MTRSKFLILFLFLFYVCSNLSAQHISKIDFDQIKKTTTDSFSRHYYPLLIQRFLRFDTTLTVDDFPLIYYGYVFTKDYNPYHTGANEDKFLKLFKQKKYGEAIPLGKEVLNENPVNIKVLYCMLVCFDRQGDRPSARNYANLYFPLLNVIYNSGDGKSIETAYVVTTVADEYELLGDLNLSSNEQALVGDTDVLTIDQEGQNMGSAKEKVKTLYFNVSKPLNNLAEMFQKKD